MEAGKRSSTIGRLERFLFLLLAVGAFAGLAGCRLPPFDLATSLSLIDDGGDPPYGYYAEGYLGNYLVVIPERRLVVVRMKRAGDPEGGGDFPTRFPRLVRDLVEGVGGG